MIQRCKRSFVFLLLATLPAFAADQHKKSEPAPPAPEVAPWDQPQPAVENIDLGMYARIREEGFTHSHIMEYASALTDDIGPRLTGSPNMAKANAWTRDQLTAMGCANAHLEDWGDFGMGWQQLNTWVRMTSPDTAVFIAQATPWSPSTSGPVTAEAVYVNIETEHDFDKYRGKLAGKIVLLGAMRDVPPVDKALFERYTTEELEKLAEYPASGNDSEDMQRRIRAYIQRIRLADQVAQFLADEKAAAVIRPSRDAADGGGSGGTIFDDNGAALGRTPYLADHAVKVPVVVMAIESYGRVYRLLEQHVPVTIQMDVETKFTGDHEHGFDTVAEIPGTDPQLKDQVVMVGGHLDSWIAGTGATDNGAGTLVSMEVMRILNALGVHPRRTIRVALWSGEEEGLFGSLGYVRQHFGSAPLSTAPDQIVLPEFLRRASGPLELKPEQKLISGYFKIGRASCRERV